MTPDPSADRPDFFVPYRPLPLAQRRFLIRLLPALLTLSLLLGLLLPALHDQYGPGGRLPVKTLTGLLLDGPGAPQLLVPADAKAGAMQIPHRVLLAGAGKTAPSAAVMAHSGQWVKLQGSVFGRDSLSIMNVRRAQAVAAPVKDQLEPRAPRPLGMVELVGEIVDAKCFSGVMKPGSGKTHRGCAIRCISGGVPAVLHTITGDGRAIDLLLVDQHNRAVNDQILPLIADPLRIQGELFQVDNLLLLRADPDLYQRA